MSKANNIIWVVISPLPFALKYFEVFQLLVLVGKIHYFTNLTSQSIKRITFLVLSLSFCAFHTMMILKVKDLHLKLFLDYPALYHF